MACAVHDHPQLAEIERAIISGKTIREIAKCANPRLSVSAVQRYKAKLVAPVVRNTAKSVAAQVLAKKTITRSNVSRAEVQNECNRATILQPFLKRVERKYKRYDSLLSEAEKANVVLDKLGNPVVLSPDLRAIAALDAAETRTMEFHGRALGILQQDQQTTTQINVALVMPSASQADRPAGASGTTIDVEPCESCE